MNTIKRKKIICQILEDLYESLEASKQCITHVDEKVNERQAVDWITGEPRFNEETGKPVMTWDWNRRKRTKEELDEHFKENPDDFERLEILNKIQKELEKLA